MKVNINRDVAVRLTRVGYEQFHKHFTDLNLSPIHYLRHYRQEDGSLIFQLWDLMNIFGPSCIMGNEPVFIDNEIEFRSAGFTNNIAENLGNITHIENVEGDLKI